ncbi:MAG: S26 family signal peptidase, partial [Candidatus Nomurabacteria bacterium]|nr:S26 family signal peptidase [Candidatus Nomurabacteria bacterium]
MNPQKSIHDIKTPTPPTNDLGKFYDELPLPPAEATEPIKTATPAKQPKRVAVSQNIPDKPLTATPIETPRPAAKNRPSWLRDVIGLGIFVVIIFIGAMLINSFIFRSFNVIGPSMEPTLEGGIGGQPNDRVIVNLVPITLSHIGGN